MIHINLLSVPHQTSTASTLHFISIPAVVMGAWMRGDSSQAPRPTDIPCTQSPPCLKAPFSSDLLELAPSSQTLSLFSFCVNAREFRCFGELHNPAVAFFSFTHPIQHAGLFVFNSLKTTRKVQCVRTPILPSRAQRWLLRNTDVHPNQFPVKCHHVQLTAGHPFFSFNIFLLHNAINIILSTGHIHLNATCIAAHQESGDEMLHTSNHSSLSLVLITHHINNLQPCTPIPVPSD